MLLLAWVLPFVWEKVLCPPLCLLAEEKVMISTHFKRNEVKNELKDHVYMWTISEYIMVTPFADTMTS